MLDQPLGFIAALRMLLDGWMRNESAERSRYVEVITYLTQQRKIGCRRSSVGSQRGSFLIVKRRPTLTPDSALSD
jgi:hypothetical protein